MLKHAAYGCGMSNQTSTLMSRQQAATALGVSTFTLESWASRGKPELPYIRAVNGRVRYRQSDIEQFIAQRTTTATSATAHKAQLASV
jgi:predicted site-specific integrase-resolvase